MPAKAVAVELPTFLTLPEIADLLRTKLPAVRTLVRTGALPYLKAGKRFIVPRAALESYIAAHTRREGVAA